MDEEEYDALTEEEKITFNREVQQALLERKKRSESRAGQSRSGSPESMTGVILHGDSSGHGRPGRMTC